MTEQLILELAVVVVGAGLLAAAAHFLRQPLIVAYLAAGFLLGPHSPVPALRLVREETFLRAAGGLGLVLLLFLLGLVLHPERLRRVFRETALVTVSTAAVFFGLVTGAMLVLGRLLPVRLPIDAGDALLIGAAMALSSTLLVVKLLPTRRLHESDVGTLAIGVLIIQDLLAVATLVVLAAVAGTGHDDLPGLAWRMPLGILMLVAAFPAEAWLLRPVMARVEQYTELLFVLGLAWCFALAEGAEHLGFSREIGAFVAGLALARSPLSLYIWERVAPLRDFFIVLLFFSLGAMVDVYTPGMATASAVAAVMAGGLILVKPLVFRTALRAFGEPPALAREAGWRLGQASEFGLVIAFLARDRGLIGLQVFELILVAALLSFALSTYIVVYRYPTPLGVSREMHVI